jgi:hypothetical protein
MDIEQDLSQHLGGATTLVLLAMTNFVSFIIGGESIATGTPQQPAVLLPGFVFDGAATPEFLAIYRPAQVVLSALAVGYPLFVTLVVLSEKTDRELSEVIAGPADDIEQ